MCMHFIFYQLSLTFISYPWLSNWDLFQITTFSDLAVERHAFLAISPCKRDGYCNGHRLSLAHIHMDSAGRYSRTLCDRTRSDVNGKAAVSLFRKGKLEDFKIDFCWLWPISTVANRYSGLFDHLTHTDVFYFVLGGQADRRENPLDERVHTGVKDHQDVLLGVRWVSGLEIG